MLSLSLISGTFQMASSQITPERAMLGMPELLVVLAIVVVLFGATKLPQLGKGLGEAIGNFKKAQRDAEKEISGREEIDATPRVGRDKHDSLDHDGPAKG